jgi:hypothetical protein
MNAVPLGHRPREYGVRPAPLSCKHLMATMNIGDLAVGDRPTVAQLAGPVTKLMPSVTGCMRVCSGGYTDSLP